MIAHADRDHPQSGVEVSPDGRYALVMTPMTASTDRTPENSLLRLVDMENHTTTLIDPDHFVAGAGWSPGGSALVYLVNEGANAAPNGLYVAATPGQAGRLLLAGDYNQPNLARWQTLIWGANNTVLLSRSPQIGIVLVRLAGA